jgi:hypothetical protein
MGAPLASMTVPETVDPARVVVVAACASAKAVGDAVGRLLGAPDEQPVSIAIAERRTVAMQDLIRPPSRFLSGDQPALPRFGPS